MFFVGNSFLNLYMYLGLACSKGVLSKSWWWTIPFDLLDMSSQSLLCKNLFWILLGSCFVWMNWRNASWNFLGDFHFIWVNTNIPVRIWETVNHTTILIEQYNANNISIQCGPRDTYTQNLWATEKLIC